MVHGALKETNCSQTTFEMSSTEVGTKTYLRFGHFLEVYERAAQSEN